MNDDFEKRLQRQPLRPIPGEWRSEILASAHAAAPARTAVPFSIRHLLSSIFWPTPYAWGGLAAVWLVIVLANVSPGERSVVTAKKTEAPSAQVIAAVREQQKLLAELVGLNQEPPALAVPPRQHPIQPRSDRRAKISAV